MLDLNLPKLLVLGVIALIVFGPERLPAMAAQAGRALRELRKLLDGAKSELQENLGPEFSQFDLADLNPKHFVRKHLMDEVTGDGVIMGAVGDVRAAANGVARGGGAANGGAANGGAANGGAANGGAANGGPTIAGAATQTLSTARLAPGESPPYDAEAT